MSVLQYEEERLDAAMTDQLSAKSKDSKLWNGTKAQLAAVQARLADPQGKFENGTLTEETYKGAVVAMRKFAKL